MSLIVGSRHDRYGSLASFMACSRDVCLSPDSGERADIAQPLLGARSGPAVEVAATRLIGDRRFLNVPLPFDAVGASGCSVPAR